MLGLDFLDKANIGLNVSEYCLYFCDKPDEKYSLCNRPPDIQVFEISEQHYLRSDEDEMFDPEQRNCFNQLLKENQDIFEQKRGATDRIQTIDHVLITVPPYPLQCGYGE